ncbi:restriction endonuclease [Listeria booriae]|uniref:restriction endonuclease n=1 Tax=Listeria booriae TaxID=1552123 RepID=UPI00162820AF|nr:restriction endonuclease [Listeria booriae]MBC1918516.1 restriction endonuclease [Listeria booriae]
MNNFIESLFNKTKSTFPFDHEDIDVFVNPPRTRDKAKNDRFTEIIARLYEYQNYKTEIIDGYNDSGADILIMKKNITTAIQIKHSHPLSKTKNIGEDVLNKLLQAKHIHKAEHLQLITTTYFIQSTIKKADSLKIELIGRDKLFNFISNVSPEFIAALSYNYSIENFKTCPHCNSGKMIVENSSKTKSYYYRCLSCKRTASMN